MRRLSPGMTRDPFDCCGKAPGDYGRRKGTICETCAGLIADGKVARAKLAESELAVYRWTEAEHGWPRFYGSDCRFPHGEKDLHREMADAFWALVNRLAVDAPADTPHHAPTYTMRQNNWNRQLERSYDPWPTVVSDPGHSYDSWSFAKLVLLPPATRDALDRLHQTIKAALGGVYRHGKAEGTSVLFGLAEGTLSLQDFDDALLTADERKARRGAR